MASNAITSTSIGGNSIVVAAIDFGTTFTGYAYSFKNDPEQIYTSQWNGPASTEVKEPTTVLLKPDTSFHSFGYEAREKYKRLLENEDDGGEKAKEWYYFNRFKMKLYKTKKLKRDTQIGDINDRLLPAIDVFSIVIGHLKDDLEKQLEETKVGIQPEDILWVVTVPAIWSDAAKQIMREAAVKVFTNLLDVSLGCSPRPVFIYRGLGAKLAGINGNHLMLVLEPEAASLHSKSLKSCRVAKVDGSFEMEYLPEGHKYIIADLGGGTADLAVHEILPGGNLREIRRSDGDAFGGYLVNRGFVKLMFDIFGTAVMKVLIANHKCDAIELNGEFEMKKRTYRKGLTDRISIKLPSSTLRDIVPEIDGCTYKNKTKEIEQRYNGRIKFVSDKMLVHPDIIGTLFEPVVDGILRFIKKMREEDELNETNTLLMVGGFSASAYVKQMVQEDNPGMRIIVPPEPSLSVLKGAVLMGHNPKTITERIARFTYGFDCARPFQYGTDPESLKREDDGRILCTSVFKKMIEKGQVLKVGDVFGLPLLHTCTTPVNEFAIITSILYKSEDKDPKYSEEKYGCEIAGAVLGFPPRGGWPPFAIITDLLVIGESEMTIVVMNTASNSVVEGKLDFL